MEERIKDEIAALVEQTGLAVLDTLALRLKRKFPGFDFLFLKKCAYEFMQDGEDNQSAKKSIWSDEEIEALKAQAAAGKLRRQIEIPGRTQAGINYIIRELYIKIPDERPDWTDEEKASLRQQLETGKGLREVQIPGRDYFGIRSEAIRLGFHKTKKRPPQKRWSAEHLDFLRFLVVEKGMTSRTIAKIGFFSNATNHSIGQQARRHKFVKEREKAEI